MRRLQIVLGILMLVLSGMLLVLGWQQYTSESASLTRYIARQAGIAVAFWEQRGIKSLACGGIGAAAALFLIGTAGRRR